MRVTFRLRSKQMGLEAPEKGVLGQIGSLVKILYSSKGELEAWPGPQNALYFRWKLLGISRSGRRGGD